ncbi:MAG TPA: hypothetical protein VKA73_10615 [Rubrobacter sp.]|nr:hypothetical protein [Rubrobacter sp.]
MGIVARINLKEVESMGTGKAVYIGATLISILISITLYRSDRQNLAIFVGLWAPTILNLGQTLVDDDPS